MAESEKKKMVDIVEVLKMMDKYLVGKASRC